MFRGKRFVNSLFALLVIGSLNLVGLVPVATATDLVPSEDVTGGASVFVFRESRKKPQERGGGMANRSGGGKAYRDKLATQITSARKRKADQQKARQAELARIRARERNAKLRLSNTLTAKAETAMATGDTNGAITNYREALKANPKNVDATGGLSDALAARGLDAAGPGLSEDAVPFLSEAVKLNPQNAVAYAKLGEIDDAHNRRDQALVNYEKALAIDPEFTSLYLPAGLAYAKSGNTAKTDLYLGKAEAAGIDTSEAKFVQIDALASQKKYPEALAALDKIIRAEPQNGEALYRRASIYDDMDQTDKAIDAYKDAARVNPANSLPWFDLGTIYYNKADYNNAEKAYLEALRIDPTSAQAHANLASVYRQKEKFPEANAEYKKAEELGMKTPDLYSEWGYCLGQTKEWDKSVARLETARAISPTAVDDNNAGWGYYNAAQVDKQAKNDAAAREKLEKSKTSFQAATQKDPKLDAAYVNLGSTHNSLGEYDQAVLALNQANQLHGDWVVALNLLGIAYRGQKNLSMALQILNRSVNLDGSNVVGLFNLGSTQNQAGDKKGAKKTQDRLKKISPDLASQLGNIIAGKLIEAGTNEIKKKILRIPF